MHLTNYSINKHSQTFDKDEGFDKGSKRLPTLNPPLPFHGLSLQVIAVFQWLAH